MMKIAVVILNWNGRALLERYIPQVVESTTYAGADIIVADNASEDDSVLYMRSAWSVCKLILLEKNYGFAGGYNRAIAQLGDYDAVVLLNSDVAPAKGWLEPMVELMETDEMVVACGPKIKDDKDRKMFEYAGAAGGFVDMYGYPYCRGRVFEKVEEDLGQYDSNADCLWVSGAALMVRRKEYIECGGLDEEFFAHMEEIDLCWRLRNMGHRIVCVAESEVFHLGGATLNSANPRKTYLNFRNNLWMMIKNHTSKLWWLILFLRMVLDGVAGFKFVLSGQVSHCWAIIKAHIDMWRSLRKMLAKRREIQSNVREKGMLPEILQGSIVWKHYVMRSM
ncbi:MAG: glycosyltransferase family 2 protein [Bacteroidales bacterium]|nr:glycosyltransferase family 2 protein [Bacteroidales bacterium]